VGRVVPAQPRAGQLLRNRVEVGDHVAIDPLDDRLVGFERQVKLVPSSGTSARLRSEPPKPLYSVSRK
jgi:hypothetical protein